jgi:hypothetical protein
MPKTVFEWESTAIGRQEHQDSGTWLGILWNLEGAGLEEIQLQ